MREPCCGARWDPTIWKAGLYTRENSEVTECMTIEWRVLTSNTENLAPPKLLGVSEDPDANSVGSMPTTRL